MRFRSHVFTHGLWTTTRVRAANARAMAKAVRDLLATANSRSDWRAHAWFLERSCPTSMATAYQRPRTTAITSRRRTSDAAWRGLANRGGGRSPLATAPCSGGGRSSSWRWVNLIHRLSGVNTWSTDPRHSRVVMLPWTCASRAPVPALDVGGQGLPFVCRTPAALRDERRDDVPPVSTRHTSCRCPRVRLLNGCFPRGRRRRPARPTPPG